MILGKADELTDGYHTMGELYDHRRALTAALAVALPEYSWRSKRHHPDDDPMFEGYFIVGIDLPDAGTITYHYNLRHWNDFNSILEMPHANKWDGAGPPETIKRLLEFASNN